MRPVRLAPPTWPCSAKRPGRQARVIATGDTAQLGAVEAGGMFRLLAQEVPAARLHEVRRFIAEWERRASVRLRDGDLAAAAAYDRHGRICGSDEEAACDRAVSLWLADHLRGKDVLLLAGSNAEAADLSRRVQAKLAQMGRAGPPQAALSDGNHAGIGDLVRLAQHRDRRRRPPAHQPRHPGDHRVPRARCRGAAAADRRDLDRDVPRAKDLSRPQRRARISSSPG
jgi:AAA domain